MQTDARTSIRADSQVWDLPAEGNASWLFNQTHPKLQKLNQVGGEKGKKKMLWGKRQGKVGKNSPT